MEHIIQGQENTNTGPTCTDINVVLKCFIHSYTRKTYALLFYRNITQEHMSQVLVYPSKTKTNVFIEKRLKRKGSPISNAMCRF